MSPPSKISHLTMVRNACSCSTTTVEGCDIGSPSSAQDFVGNCLNHHEMCTTESGRILDTSKSYVVIDQFIKLTVGDVLLILSDVFTQFSRRKGKVLITSDGEAIEDEVLKGMKSIIQASIDR